MGYVTTRDGTDIFYKDWGPKDAHRPAVRQMAVFCSFFIRVDANNPIEAPLFKPVPLGGRSSSEVFADLVPGARVVKAFNHLQPHLVAGDPSGNGGKRVLFYSGDDCDAKARTGALIDRLGFLGIDLGPLALGSRLVQFPGGPLAALNLVKFNN